MSDYLADVRRYDSDADEATVDKIVKHLGIALRSSRDAALVSCSDKSERERVCEKWCEKKLGVSEEEGHKVIESVCKQMSDSKQKSRVTFYYLVAKSLNKLDTL